MRLEVTKIEFPGGVFIGAVTRASIPRLITGTERESHGSVGRSE